VGEHRREGPAGERDRDWQMRTRDQWMRDGLVGARERCEREREGLAGERGRD
jgi:hypothetical protein